ncbi:MAG: nuclease [endosymbiont of Galathealinum brachiosum]|uniref:Nuclease n=1 Tax=endosymbiont of Galathealinum brachiosum TaxID=2200906 RepID=A0A370DGG8_9GAMM|nr:MAG: nuclease [endosymbiont of Galathealinum brachiosum]
MKFLVVLFMLVSSAALAADKHFGDVVVSEVTSIYDADTFKVNIKGWPDVIGKRISVRVLGVDAPEIRGKCTSEKTAARLAKQFTVQFLRSGSYIELRNIKRGKYFRILADVFVDDQNLAKALIMAKHGRPYNGGKRQGWCVK